MSSYVIVFFDRSLLLCSVVRFVRCFTFFVERCYIMFYRDPAQVTDAGLQALSVEEVDSGFENWFNQRTLDLHS